jgi:hypothetical protein
MSEEGKVVGFQPTNLPAVNHWTTNPLATLLYQGRSLSPGTTRAMGFSFICMGTGYQIYLLKWTLSGIIEPRLKISRPAKAAPIELLMSVNQDSFFALARPVEDPW